MASEELESTTEALRANIDSMSDNVVCIPEGFPGAEDILKNIDTFLKKNATKVAHLIMVIHDERAK